MTCECNVCQTLRRWRTVLQIDTPEKEAVFNEIVETWENESMDADYYRAIMDGSWPSAVELLENALDKARTRAQDSQM